MPDKPEQSPKQVVQGCLVIVVFGALIVGACAGVVAACSSGDGDDTPSRSSYRSSPSGSSSTSSSSSGSSSAGSSSSVQLTTEDRECLRWGRLSGNDAGLTEADVRSTYSYWRQVSLPACRGLRGSIRETCSAMEEEGLNPRNDDHVREAVRATFGNLSEYNNISAAIEVWCD